MKKLSHCLLLCIISILVSCNPRTPQEFFKRPVIRECITLIQDGATIGMMACNGVLKSIPSKLTILEDQENVEEIRLYSEEREYQNYRLCLKFPKTCLQK